MAENLRVEVGSGQPIWACGMMTGTSMDGLDMALIRTDGEALFEFGPTWFAPLWPGLRARLSARLDEIAALPEAVVAERARWPSWLVALEDDVTAFHQWALDGFRADARPLHPFDLPQQTPWQGLREVRSGAVGVHGQTVLHRPEAGITLQLFKSMFAATLPVVSDFRQADMAAGGEGAPLAPFYHWALARHVGFTEPVAFLNLGGVANITWVDPQAEAPELPGALVAFDTGPANALIDDLVCARTGASHDAGGRLAAAGTIHRERLHSNAAAAYLARPGPKSLDRNAFQAVRKAVEPLSTEDAAATLTAFTAECVAAALPHLPSEPTRWLVCGGGRLNTTLMAMLSERLQAPVEPVEAHGLDGDMLEAQCFAFLAVRVLRGLATSAPSTTGCRQPTVGGRIGG
ncbi:MAG: anhydro-N-acetylmuramic acid kinase [Pseudomonadota bacterium]